MCLRVFYSPLHKCSYCSWSCVKNIYFIFFNNTPQSFFIWSVWCSLIHNTRCLISKRTIDNIAMTSYPSTISSTPVNIILFYIKNCRMCSGYSGKVSGLCVDYSLWFCGSARCVEYVKHIFCIHDLWFTCCILFIY